MRPRISIWGLVRPSVGRSVGWSVGYAFVQIDENWPFTDSKWFSQCWTRKKEGRGGRRDEEEGGTRRKDGRGGRMDAEKVATWRKERWGEWKNEKVAKKWKMKKWLEDASLTSGSCFSAYQEWLMPCIRPCFSVSFSMFTLRKWEKYGKYKIWN